ncbi:MAG TPA: DUF2130 domain-containing protein [Methanofastidiosum sp.]|jgi:hypothetical protein|nr:DUF2130 domain-containing protein [Methanofastidiosum sp.]HOH70063.1 DUF2130 domain-containing protein [Sedimentibacter sp.]
MPANTRITCPKCGHEFNVEDVLAQQIEEKYRNEMNKSISKIQEEFTEKENAIKQKETEIREQQANIDHLVAEKLKEESVKATKQLKNQFEKQYEQQLKTLSEEAEYAKTEISNLKTAKIENEQLKRKLNDQEQDLALKYEQTLTDKLKQETETIQKRESERVELKIKERDELIGSLKKQVEEMSRKAEQGSMQVQGEVQELAIEEILRNMFPVDLIEEVGKGIKGADVIHTVRNRFGVDCGKILYESKRTKTFVNDWIPKLKADALTVKADVLVIITEALPEGIEKIGQKDGIWICSFFDFKGLVIILRESLLKISEAFSSQTNKGEKMQMLYDYLTSNEFMMQISAIIEGFSDLQDSYIREKRAMERIWKEREKQLQKVLLNTNHFIGSIKGIAGTSIPQLKEIGPKDNILELPENEA